MNPKDIDGKVLPFLKRVVKNPGTPQTEPPLEVDFDFFADFLDSMVKTMEAASAYAGKTEELTKAWLEEHPTHESTEQAQALIEKAHRDHLSFERTVARLTPYRDEMNERNSKPSGS